MRTSKRNFKLAQLVSFPMPITLPRGLPSSRSEPRARDRAETRHQASVGKVAELEAALKAAVAKGDKVEMYNRGFAQEKAAMLGKIDGMQYALISRAPSHGYSSTSKYSY